MVGQDFIFQLAQLQCTLTSVTFILSFDRFLGDKVRNGEVQNPCGAMLGLGDL